MPKKYTENFLDTAKLLFKSGHNLKDTARIMGCNPRVLSNFLQTDGLNTIAGRSHTAVNRINTLPVEKISELYKNGQSIHSLSNEFNVSRGALERILSEMGLAIRSRAEANSLRWKNTNNEDRRSQMLLTHAARNGSLKD